MLVGHVQAKSILVPSRIPGVPYVINPYVGCTFGCSYCYAAFMAKYSGHQEPWGNFVDVKDNAPALLFRELMKSRPGRVMMSSVTDPYQPVEKKAMATRRCLEVLLEYSLWADVEVSILTRSPLVVRDIDLFRKFRQLEVGLSITTDNDAIRRIFEPKAPPIRVRLKALDTLKAAGVATYAAISPILPMDASALARLLAGKIDRAFVDRMNYPWKVAHLYRRHGLEYALQASYFQAVARILKEELEAQGVRVETFLDP
jgi:DNA repair photolyase